MSSKQNIIYIYFKGKHLITSKSQYQYNHGQFLYFADLNLPQAFEVHFSNKDKGDSKTQIGSNKLVEIPDEYFWNGALMIYAWIYLHSETTDGETVYEVRIPLIKRAKPTDEEPLPQQQGTIDRAIAELNNAVNVTNENANKTEADKTIVANIKEDVISLKEDIDDTATVVGQKAQEAIDASERAEAFAQNAAQYESNALNYSQQAEQSAQQALESKNIASQKAEVAINASSETLGYRDEALEAKNQAVQAKQNIVDYRDETKGYRDETLTIKNNVQTLKSQIDETAEEIEDISDSIKEDAQSASQSASSASQSSTNASQSASQAKKSANDAEESANQAEQNKNQTETFKNQSEEYKTQAETLKNQAEQFKNQSETNVSHYPKIVNDYWYGWDATNGEYINTNVYANGIKGDTGNGISSAVLNNDYTLTLTFTDGTTYTTSSIRGEKGEQGDPASSMDIHICSSSEYDSQTRIPTIAQPNNITFYLVPTVDGTSPDLFTEWVYVNNAWEMFGSASIDLSGYLTDVTVGGTSVVTDGVAEIPIVDGTKYGVVRTTDSFGVSSINGYLFVSRADLNSVKKGTNNNNPIVPNNQHESTFYGLAKAAGHDEKDSTLPVGQYTDEAKASIQDMLEVPSNADLDEVEEKVDQNTEDLLKAYPTDTANGNIASFEDGANDIPLQSLVVDIDTVQDLHGYDSPWVGGGGKNLLPPNEVDETKTQSGMTITATNGVYRLSGTATEGSFFTFKLLKPFNMSPSTNKICFLNTVKEGAVLVYFTRNGETIHYWSMSSVNRVAKDWSDTGNEEIDGIKIVFTAGTSVDITISPMFMSLNESDATEFTPYENICPISGWTGVTIQKHGKNLIDIEDKTLSVAKYLFNGAITLPSGMYTLTYTTTATESGALAVVGVNGNNQTAIQTISGTKRTWHITADVDITSMRLYGSAGDYSNFQLELGTEATDYKPYQGSIVNVDWTDEAGTVYGGKLDVLSGVLTVDKIGVILDGINNRASNLNAYTDVIRCGFAYGTGEVAKYNGRNTYIISDSATPSYEQTINGGTSIGHNGVYVYPHSSMLFISFGINRGIDTREKCDIWLQDNPIKVIYELAEPQTYQLTPHEVNSLLGVNNIFADTGDTACEYRADSDLYIQRKMPEVPVNDVQINGSSIVVDGVANVPIADKTTRSYGVVRVGDYGVNLYDNTLCLDTPTSAQLKAGATRNRAVTVYAQHESTFYGLAKASGDTTQSQSDNAVGTYTDDAKSSIQTMLGVPSEDDVVNDVQLNGTSIVSNGTANIPMATSSTLGICFANPNRGIGIRTSSETDAGQLYVDRAYNGVIKIAADEYRPIVPFTQHVAVFYGLAKLAGADMSTSSNAIGTYTDEAKTAIKQMLGVKDNYDSFIVNVDGTDPVITGQPSYRYNCDEVYSLTVTPPSSGTIDFRFTSGSTPTVLTLPSTVKMPEWWVEVEANTIYEMCITDGIYCGVMSWAMT